MVFQFLEVQKFTKTGIKKGGKVGLIGYLFENSRPVGEGRVRYHAIKPDGTPIITGIDGVDDAGQFGSPNVVELDQYGKYELYAEVVDPPEAAGLKSDAITVRLAPLADPVIAVASAITGILVIIWSLS